MSKMTVVMEQTAPKKHSVRYDSVQKTGVPVGTVYVMKAALPPVPPERITLTIEY